MKKIWTVLAITIVFSVMTLYAQTEAEVMESLNTQAAVMNQTALNLGEEKTLQVMSAKLGVPYETLVQQKQQTGFGMGELFIANSLASSLQTTDPTKNFDALVQEFQAGKGWGAIARENGVKLGAVVSQMRRSEKAMKNALMKNEHKAAGREGKSRQGAGSQGGGSQRGGGGRGRNK